VEIGHSYSNDFNAIGNHKEGKPDFLVVKLSADGNVIWNHCYGGIDAPEETGDNPYAVISSSDGGYLLVGRSDSNNGDVSGNHGSVDIWAVKLYSDLSACQTPQTLTTTNLTSSSAQLNWNAANGTQSYKVKYKKRGNNPWVSNITMNTSLTIQGLLSSTNYTWQVKSQCQSNASSEWSDKMPFTTNALRNKESQLIDLACYPNPASSSVTIAFNLPEDENISIEVFNLIQQKIREPVNGDFEAGSHQIEMSVKDFPPGIYLVKMSYSGTETIKKLVVD
jgi:hypothetical protein